MKYLIDTNVFIKAEPTSPDNVEPLIDRVADLIRLISEADSQAYVHPASLSDIENDTNSERRKLRKALFRKYQVLQNPPQYVTILGGRGLKPKNNHDCIDYELVASVFANAVDFLVSEDDGVHKLAAKLKLSDRVVTIACAVDILTAMLATAPIPPPCVKAVFAYELNENDYIFSSFRHDYKNFDSWLTKCKREHRQAWVIEGEQDEYAGLCIIKQSSDKRLKICSFKILETHRGNKFGELLLKTVFDYCYENRIEESYLTVFEKYGLLIQLFEDFGFRRIGHNPLTGELVLSKQYALTTKRYEDYKPLDFNIMFGPHAVKIDQDSCFIVPIYPNYHAMLFPDYERQIMLLPTQTSYGNSIKKAYVSNSKIRKIRPGSSLLFYKISPFKEICAIGVTEDILVSSNVNDMMRFIAKRTIFSYEQIQDLCAKDCLGILFRQAFQLEKPITIDELKEHAKLKSSPQQIMSIPKDGIVWIRKMIGKQCF